MICVRLAGGLGNQLFQYAAGRALSIRLCTDLVFDTSTLARKSKRVTQRDLELQRFNYSGRLATSSEMRFLPWSHRFIRASALLTPWRTYVEKNDTYDSCFHFLKDNTYLVGYWQSFKYFSSISSILIKDLELASPLSLESTNILRSIQTSESVSLHIRRGDYVTLASASRHHGALPLSYYLKSLEILNQRIKSPKYFIFSDDPSWCRYSFSLPDDSVFVDINAGSDAWQDLILMSYCKHNVIANSSFSWWSAWLGDQRAVSSNRLVFAPENWFRESKRDAIQNRFPCHWFVH
jgi:hypothetical protein